MPAPSWLLLTFSAGFRKKTVSFFGLWSSFFLWDMVQEGAQGVRWLNGYILAMDMGLHHPGSLPNV